MIISLGDYSNLFDGKDATLAVLEALSACRLHPGSTLRLGGGELHFYRKYAFQREYYISNNDYSMKSIIFPLIGMKDITIDGEGAELFFHGEVLPFVLDGSENIVLKNFTVDIPHPFFFQAEITAAGDDFLELTWDPSEFAARIQGRNFVFFCDEEEWSIKRDCLLCCEFERDTKAPSSYLPPYFACLRQERDTSFLSHMFRYLTPIQTAENKIRLEGEIGYAHNVGNQWVCTFSDRKNPGIFCNRSKNILLENVTLYAAASMGLICQLCENITMERFKTVPRPDSGRCLSVNADATHFVNCSGYVRYEGCVFTNMLDDAGNIHGNYLKCVRAIDDHTLLLSFGHSQQRGVNIFDAGDRIHIVDGKEMRTTATLTVEGSDLISGDFIRLAVRETLPELRQGDVAENFTKMPELYIHNCVSGYNRPRGFLPGTWKKTVITNNIFTNMLHGLHFTGDGKDWFESGPVQDVQVKGNYFYNSAYAGGAAISVEPGNKGGKTPYHRNIIIEDNVFEMHEERFLSADNVEDLVFRGNRFLQNDKLPSHPKTGQNGIELGDTCPNAQVEQPWKVEASKL